MIAKPAKSPAPHLPLVRTSHFALRTSLGPMDGGKLLFYLGIIISFGIESPTQAPVKPIHIVR